MQRVCNIGHIATETDGEGGVLESPNVIFAGRDQPDEGGGGRTRRPQQSHSKTTQRAQEEVSNTVA